MKKKLLLRKRGCSKLVEIVISSQILGVFGTLKFNWQKYLIFSDFVISVDKGQVICDLFAVSGLIKVWFKGGGAVQNGLY